MKEPIILNQQLPAFKLDRKLPIKIIKEAVNYIQQKHKEYPIAFDGLTESFHIGKNADVNILVTFCNPAKVPPQPILMKMLCETVAESFLFPQYTILPLEVLIQPYTMNISLEDMFVKVPPPAEAYTNDRKLNILISQLLNRDHLIKYLHAHWVSQAPDDRK